MADDVWSALVTGALAFAHSQRRRTRQTSSTTPARSSASLFDGSPAGTAKHAWINSRAISRRVAPPSKPVVDAVKPIRESQDRRAEHGDGDRHRPVYVGGRRARGHRARLRADRARRRDRRHCERSRNPSRPGGATVDARPDQAHQRAVESAVPQPRRRRFERFRRSLQDGARHRQCGQQVRGRSCSGAAPTSVSLS